MREIKGEEVTKTSRQFDCSLNCALIVLEFDELDQSLSLQDRLIFAWRRSMCFAGYDEYRAQNLLVEFLSKANLGC